MGNLGPYCIGEGPGARKGAATRMTDEPETRRRVDLIETLVKNIRQMELAVSLRYGEISYATR